MAIELNQLGPAALEINIPGRLEKDDYKHFTPIMEQLLKRNEKIGLLVHISDFEGWSVGALWEDLKFDFKHFNDVSRIAFVAEDTNKKWMATLSKPFTTADVEFYPESRIDAARKWVKTAPAAQTA